MRNVLHGQVCGATGTEFGTGKLAPIFFDVESSYVCTLRPSVDLVIVSCYVLLFDMRIKSMMQRKQQQDVGGELMGLYLERYRQARTSQKVIFALVLTFWKTERIFDSPYQRP